MKVIFDFSKQQIAIEGDGDELVKTLGIVRDIAPNLPNINIVATTTSAATEPAIQGNGFRRENQANGSAQTLRQFVRSVPLDNTYERIAAVLYYQTKVANVATSLSPKEIGGLFTQCGFQKPSQMSVALSDAKRRYGYVESAGHGTWRVSTNGENLLIGKIEQGPASQED